MDPDSGTHDRCTHCGAQVEPTAWHPALAVGGTVYTFCSAACRDAYADHHADDPSR